MSLAWIARAASKAQQRRMALRFLTALAPLWNRGMARSQVLMPSLRGRYYSGVSSLLASTLHWLHSIVSVQELQISILVDSDPFSQFDDLNAHW